MPTKKSKVVNFVPNEALGFNDLNDIQKALTMRAWEMPAFSNVLTPQRFVDVGGASYAGTFDAPSSLRKIAFTMGAGPLVVGSGGNVFVSAA